MEQQLGIESIETVFCIVGNDGTGKTTLCSLRNANLRKSGVFWLQRSSMHIPSDLQVLRKQLKQLDLLTFTLAHEKERKDFYPIHQITLNNKLQQANEIGRKIKVLWFVLDLEPQKILQRLRKRLRVDKYDSKKAVQYFSYVYRQMAYYYGFPLIRSDRSSEEVASEILSFSNPTTYSQIQILAFQKMTLEKIHKMDLEMQIREHLRSHPHELNRILSTVQKSFRSSQMFDFYNAGADFDKIFSKSQNSLGKIESSEEFELLVMLCARWLLKSSSVERVQGRKGLLELSYSESEGVEESPSQRKLRIQSPEGLPLLKIKVEGESKILYSVMGCWVGDELLRQYFGQKVIILLKSTIYSHTNQHTGEIPSLNRIRAMGNILFLEMMRRNNLRHSYLCVNQEGVILSDFVRTNELEIVFKKECLGTDKHSYFGIRGIPDIIERQKHPLTGEESHRYKSGVYVRFDWRNPNHCLVQDSSVVINQDWFYFVVEKYYGKQSFFKRFLTDSRVVKILGDKCITSDPLNLYADLLLAKVSALRLYSTFEYYANKVGLEILDGCFMFDQSGEVGWSEINPDCMRVKALKDKEDFDKDIWRAGGSSSKDLICLKWNAFNKLFSDWMKANPFHETEMLDFPELCYPYQTVCRAILDSNPHLSQEYRSIFQSLTRTKKSKRIIGTVDISGQQPVLVKSSRISESHSEGSIDSALKYISLLQEVVLVDLDAALGRQSHNRALIRKIVEKERPGILGVGGGIRNQEVLSEFMNQIRPTRVILSSELGLLNSIEDKLIVARHVIVELSINENDEVLTHGRTANSRQSIDQVIEEVILPHSVQMISITFHQSEGHLRGFPKKQLTRILLRIPPCVKDIIIAGGISSVEDLRWIWGWQRCIPQLGSAIWKRQISLGQIYEELITWDEKGLVGAIILERKSKNSSQGKILGHVYLNAQAVKKTCAERVLYRYSRKHKKVMKKGQSSGNVFQVVGLKLDCDNDSLIIFVEPESDHHDIFCHLGSKTCFDKEGSQRSNFKSLSEFSDFQEHIRSRKQSGSGYSKRMSENLGLCEMKLFEELQEMTIASTPEQKISEAADLLSHFLMYLNGSKIDIGEVYQQMEKRAQQKVLLLDSHGPLSLQKQKKQSEGLEEGESKKTHKIKVGVVCGKHTKKIDVASEQLLGLKIIRSDSRDCKIYYQVTNAEKKSQFFGERDLQMIGIKSKDIPRVIAKGIIDFAINYSIMMENHPKVSDELCSTPVQGLKLALLSRNSEGDGAKPELRWTPQNKGRVVSEYPVSVTECFSKKSVSQNVYTLIQVNGNTEGYLVQNNEIDYCDAIVESGKTVSDNNLRIVEVLKNEISAALYRRI